MFKQIKNIDTFDKNVILVFAGTSLANFFNLLYQLLIAHRLTPVDFAAFNSLLAIFMVISAPLATLQTAVAKYSAEFHASNQMQKTKFLLSALLRKTLVLSILTFGIFYLSSFYILDKLKITSLYPGYILAALIALSWITPVLSGGLQGLELFKWLMLGALVSGGLKLIFAFIFILLGFNIAGALGALLVSVFIGLLISYYPLRGLLSLRTMTEELNFKEILFYLFPVAISSLCFYALVSFDMVLVKYYFIPEESGLYALAQMVGKIFLFLPAAISIVMFPKTAGLKAKNMDTTATLKRSLLYAGILCILASSAYNLFPGFILKVLTGKAFLKSILLGRLFSISMSFFTLLFILSTYFISLKDLRFLKYLVFFTLLQFLAIGLFHKSLIQVQSILCLNAILLFGINFTLVNFKKPKEA